MKNIKMFFFSKYYCNKIPFYQNIGGNMIFSLNLNFQILQKNLLTLEQRDKLLRLEKDMLKDCSSNWRHCETVKFYECCIQTNFVKPFSSQGLIQRLAGQ